MKRIIIAAAIVFALNLGLAFGNPVEVIRMEINKEIPELFQRALTRLETYIKMEVDNLDFDNPIDLEASKLTLYKDDKGSDMLAKDRKIKQDYIEQGHHIDNTNFYWNGIGDYGANKDIKVAIHLDVSPSKGAKEIQIQGKLILNLYGDDRKVITLKNIPVERDYGAQGVQTQIGMVSIGSNGSVSTEDLTYEIFKVRAEVPIVDVVVIKGDDKQTVKGMGIGTSPGEIYFQNPPEQVDITVTYSNYKKVEIPINLKITLGI